MNIWQEFVRGSSVSFGLKILGLATTFFAQVALVRWLSTEGFGVYSYVFTVISLTSLLAQLGLPAALVRFIAAARVQEAWAQLRGVLRITQLLGMVGSLCLVVCGELILWGISSWIDNPLKITLQLGLLLLPIHVLASLRAQALRGMKLIVASQVGEELVVPLLMILGALLLGAFGVAKPVHAMLLRFAVLLVPIGLSLRWLYRHLPPEARRAVPEYNLRELFAVSLPMFAVVPMQAMLYRTDVILLGYFSTLSDVAIYTVAQRIANLVLLGLTAANVIAAPLISEGFAKKDQDGLRAAAFLAAAIATAFTLGCVIFLALFEGWVFRLFGPEYQAGSLPMWLLVSGQTVNSIAGPVGVLLTMTAHQKRFFWIMAISALFNCVLNALLIPRFGMIGAAVATLLSTVLWNSWMCAQVALHLKINPTVFSRNMVSKALSAFQ